VEALPVETPSPVFGGVGGVARPHTASVAAHAAVHGYTTAFWWSAGIFFAGAILTALVLKPGVQQTSRRPEPALTH